MATLRGPDRREEFRFRRLDKPDEFRQLSDVTRAAWGSGLEEVVPIPLQRALQDNGGLVLGAFSDIYLAGFALGFLGWDGTTLYHYSHITAVRPEYQNHRVGIRLKVFQREEVLKQGLKEARWTFDPLQSRNALVNIRRLGGRPDQYYVHYYGQMDDQLNRGLETDRLRLIWELSSPRVEERIAGRLPTKSEDLERWKAAKPIVETEQGESGIRIPTSVTEPTERLVHLEIPFDLGSVRQHEAAFLGRWRHAVRDAFRSALDTGYRVSDFAVVNVEQERRSFYFLEAPVSPAATGSDAH